MDSERKTEDPVEPASPPDWVEDRLDGATGKDVRVGVIDSGWDPSLSLPWVQGGVGFVDPSDDLATKKTKDTADQIGHGTACGVLIHQVAPGATLCPIRVFGSTLETSPSTIGRAIEWAVDQDLDVLNVSLGTLRDDVLIPLYKICEQARRQNILVVASRHNQAEGSYPSVFENVISVGIGPFDDPFAFRYRPDDAVECLAKGRHNSVLWLNGERRSLSGTSFAAPNITGIVTRIRERYPDADIETARSLLDTFSISKS
jgi:subtilisin family serine protease